MHGKDGDDRADHILIDVKFVCDVRRWAADIDAIVLHVGDPVVMEFDHASAQIHAVVAVGELAVGNFPIMIERVGENFILLKACGDEQGVAVHACDMTNGSCFDDVGRAGSFGAGFVAADEGWIDSAVVGIQHGVTTENPRLNGAANGAVDHVERPGGF